MTKLETIIKAWIDLGIKTPFGICNVSGYAFSYCVNGIDDILSEFSTIKDKIEFHYSENDILKWRPKSLQGIENNNGWINIENESDLPTEYTKYYFVIRETEEIETRFFDIRYCDKKYCVKKYSHYQKFQFPKSPIH